jgi:hypothetical protein
MSEQQQPPPPPASSSSHPEAPSTPKPTQPPRAKGMRLFDGFALCLNIMSSVFIISVNKTLMGSGGYGFRYVVTLNALHYIATTIWSVGSKKIGLVPTPKHESASVPLSDILFFTFFANMSIISLNTSLMMNSITMYQIAKLGIIPCTALVEKML